MKQTFRPINQAEKDWVASCIANARTLVEASSPSLTERDLTPEILDSAYEFWLNSGGEIESQANDVIHAIGLAFGQFLVDRDGFEWVVVTDQFGTSIGVRALPKKGDVLVCPTSIVAKRWETRETRFFSPVYRAVLDQRDEIEASWNDKKTSPWWKLW